MWVTKLALAVHPGRGHLHQTFLTCRHALCSIVSSVVSLLCRKMIVPDPSVVGNPPAALPLGCVEVSRLRLAAPPPRAHTTTTLCLSWVATTPPPQDKAAFLRRLGADAVIDTDALPQVRGRTSGPDPGQCRSVMRAGAVGAQRSAACPQRSHTHTHAATCGPRDGQLSSLCSLNCAQTARLLAHVGRHVVAARPVWHPPAHCTRKATASQSPPPDGCCRQKATA